MLRVSIGSDGAGGEGAAVAAAAAIAQATGQDAMQAQLVVDEPRQERRQGIEEPASGSQHPALQAAAAAEPAAGGSPGASPYHRAVAACAAQPDLACLTAAGRQPGGGGREFRFPHAFIVGWQKSATTSLYATLMHHPSVLASKVKVGGRGKMPCDALLPSKLVVW